MIKQKQFTFYLYPKTSYGNLKFGIFHKKRWNLSYVKFPGVIVYGGNSGGNSLQKNATHKFSPETIAPSKNVPQKIASPPPKIATS